MKPILFLIFLITATTTITVAQSHTRDVLFPHFAEDKAKLEAKEKKGDHSAPKQQGRSSKETIFTSYKPQSATRKAKTFGAQSSRKQSSALPSEMSAQAALEKQKAQTTTTNTPAAATLPTQGEEPKADIKKATSGQLIKH